MNIHAPGGIRTHIVNMQAAADLRFRLYIMHELNRHFCRQDIYTNKAKWFDSVLDWYY